MASSASGQYAANSVFWLATRAGKMERYYPPRTARFVPANKISPKFKRVHDYFLLRFFVISPETREYLFILSCQKPENGKWSPNWTANNPAPQMIPDVDRKWSPKENNEWHGFWFLGFFFLIFLLSFFFFFHQLKDKLNQIKEKIYWQRKL